jgi:hypothetical protein
MRATNGTDLTPAIAMPFAKLSSMLSTGLRDRPGRNHASFGDGTSDRQS